jgi:hypothetical protein
MRRSIELRRELAKVKPWDSVSHQMVCSDIRIECVRVPNNEEIRKLILEEAHFSPYTVHLGGTKMYQDLKRCFWWNGMKRDVVEFVEWCSTCQQVKAEHQRPAGPLQPLEIPVWKWEAIAMDFLVGLPRTQAGYDVIWVIVDRLTKVAHFISIKVKYSLEKLT